jgi:hypothetical protein
VLQQRGARATSLRTSWIPAAVVKEPERQVSRRALPRVSLSSWLDIQRVRQKRERPNARHCWNRVRTNRATCDHPSRRIDRLFRAPSVGTPSGRSGRSCRLPRRLQVDHPPSALKTRTRRFQRVLVWSVPGSNRRPPACKAVPTSTTADDSRRLSPATMRVCASGDGRFRLACLRPFPSVWGMSGARRRLAAVIARGGGRPWMTL